MFPLQKLDDQQIDWCLKTISSNTFYLLVGNALSNKQKLSVVRMADGERSLLKQCMEGNDDEIISPPGGEMDDWLDRYGCRGITIKELLQRLTYAAIQCDFFAPSVSGIVMNEYRMYDSLTTREYYVDNFFPNTWTEEMKIELYRKAGHILFIHTNRAMADAIQIRCKYALDVKVTYLELHNWQQSKDVIDQAIKIDAPLVLFSGGPANKYIGPSIANLSEQSKVVLDIGAAAQHWLLPSLKDLPQVVGRYNM